MGGAETKILEWILRAFRSDPKNKVSVSLLQSEKSVETYFVSVKKHRYNNTTTG